MKNKLYIHILGGPLYNHSLQLLKRVSQRFFHISRVHSIFPHFKGSIFHISKVHFPHFQGRVSTFKKRLFHTLRGPFSTFQRFILHNSRVHFAHFRGRIFHISKVNSRIHFHISRADFSHLQACFHSFFCV